MISREAGYGREKLVNYAVNYFIIAAPSLILFDYIFFKRFNILGEENSIQFKSDKISFNPRRSSSGST